MSTTFSPGTALTQLHLDTTWPSPSTVLVVVAGDVDLTTADLLRDRLLGLLDERSPVLLDVDLAGVSFLDCTGIAALVAVRNAAVRAGRRVRIIHPQPIVRRVLEVAGLLGPFSAPIDRPPPISTGSETPVPGRPRRRDRD